MKLWHALISGLAGAAALTLLHQAARRVTPEAPRMDLLGMQAISKSMRKLDVETPPRNDLYRLTMLGDLLSNTLYYSLIGIGGDGRSVWARGSLMGLLAGLGGVVLPEPLGLDSAPSNRTRATQVMTILWYTTGGAVTALVYRLLRGQNS
jgi:hypothetical protein